MIPLDQALKDAESDLSELSSHPPRLGFFSLQSSAQPLPFFLNAQGSRVPKQAQTHLAEDYSPA